MLDRLHHRWLWGCLLAAGLMTSAQAATLARSSYGTTQDGQAVDLYTLTNDHGMRMRFISYGGVITAIEVPDRDGHLGDVVLGFSSLRDYETKSATIYFGAIIGRYANRIGGAQFTLDGQTYKLAANDHGNSLHGGTRGFDKVVWQVTPQSTADGASAVLTHTSPDGDEGYPGTLTVRVTYTLTNADALRIDYEATTDKDTVLNLTNHSYFNLAGNGSGDVSGQLLHVNADHYTPVNALSIPSGELAPVAGTPLDFREMMPIGARLRSGFEQMVFARGYDHNWVLNKPQPDALGFAARAYDPRSGRVLDCFTTEPGVQVYTGNFLDGTVAGSSGGTYRQGDAFTLETQRFPDSPNKPGFPTTVLKPGQTFRSTTIFRFATDAALPSTERP